MIFDLLQCMKSLIFDLIMIVFHSQFENERVSCLMMKSLCSLIIDMLPVVLGNMTGVKNPRFFSQKKSDLRFK